MKNIFLVGGAVRDLVLKENPKDFDFSVESNSFDEMKESIINNGFEIFLESPQYFTIRARAKNNWSFANIDMSHKTFDFVLCRKEGEYSDGRRPDSVSVGSIEDDLSRRDFTVNAMAMDALGNILDPWNGKEDLQSNTLKCVGNTEDRLKEDSLRMIRAIRFVVTKNLWADVELSMCLHKSDYISLLDNVSMERVREELHKMLKHDTLKSLEILDHYRDLRNYIFSKDIWLMPTTKK